MGLKYWVGTTTILLVIPLDIGLALAPVHLFFLRASTELAALISWQLKRKLQYVRVEIFFFSHLFL